jgi:YegS/Rv2252/BmrU family lipid kinase
VSRVVIINPVSGGGRHRGRERASLAASALAGAGFSAEILLTERRGHARELAAAAVARGVTLVCAWGGDGTMNEVASALVRSPASLGLIPAGSGNGLARTLGVAPDPARAIVDACRATPRTMDAGQCEGEWFFSVAGVGFDARVAAGFDAAGFGRRGLSTYVRVTARAFLTYRARAYTIDGVRTARPALLVTVANSAQFGNGAWIAPHARVDDGRLDLVVVQERHRLASLWAIPRLFTKTVDRVPGVSIRPVSRVVIEDAQPFPYHLDGEPKRPAARLTIEVRPAALQVSVR